MPESSISPNSNHMRVGMISLGCPKTLVDSEIILGKLNPELFSISATAEDSDILILNTCSFIQEAQKESIDYILDLLDQKKRGVIKHLIVVGCMVQRFPEAMQSEFSEVDAFVGSGEYHKLPEVIASVVGGEHVFVMDQPGYLHEAAEPRVALTPKYFRYLKISEGCDHICTFCTIPSFRGKHRSRLVKDILEEANQLAAAGAKEIVLTGQDTSFYGRDFSGKFLLPELLTELNQIDKLKWIRVLYAYPSCIDEKLMNAMQGLDKVCAYLDMPLQHASDPMLLAMKRGITKRRTKDLLKQFRSIVDGLVMRTTFIVGFPGETEQDFEELLEFVEEMRFEKMGAFKYSKEYGSPAADFKNQIEEAVKDVRYDRLMTLQNKISGEVQQSHVGKTFDVLVEEASEGDFVGRTYMDAPDIDGKFIIQDPGEDLKIGGMYPCKATESDAYDLKGKVIS